MARIVSEERSFAEFVTVPQQHTEQGDMQNSAAVICDAIYYNIVHKGVCPFVFCL